VSAGLRAYRKAAADLAPPHERAVAAHERAVDCLRHAIAMADLGELALHKSLLCRGIALVGALPAEIDAERAGALGDELVALYGYAAARLSEANARGDVGPIRDAVAVLERLGRGFRAAGRAP
jgi:flagellin-specific chaperone FliS